MNLDRTAISAPDTIGNNAGSIVTGNNAGGFSPGFLIRTRAFTFVEVLFAIMILGIGFIMIAAMLPVAIKQTEDTQSDITGRAICDAAYSQMLPLVQLNVAEMPVRTGFLPDRVSYSGFTALEANYAGELTSRIRGTTQSSSDGRFAYTALLRRPSATAPHEAIVIALQSRNLSEYPQNLFNMPGNPRANNDNGPHIATFTIAEGDTVSGGNITTVGLDRITFSAVDLSGGASLPAGERPTLIRDGTYVVTIGGKIFQVGQQLSGNTYELRPGTNRDLPLIAYSNGTFGVDTTFTADTTGYVVGAGLRDPNFQWDATDNPFTGPTQDIGVMRMTLK